MFSGFLFSNRVKNYVCVKSLKNSVLIPLYHLKIMSDHFFSKKKTTLREWLNEIWIDCVYFSYETLADLHVYLVAEINPNLHLLILSKKTCS